MIPFMYVLLRSSSNSELQRIVSHDAIDRREIENIFYCDKLLHRSEYVRMYKVKKLSNRSENELVKEHIVYKQFTLCAIQEFIYIEYVLVRVCKDAHCCHGQCTLHCSMYMDSATAPVILWRLQWLQKVHMSSWLEMYLQVLYW
jgi:hypothetical protein